MFQENILLSHYSNYKIGGPTRYFLEAKTTDEIIETVKKLPQIRKPLFILGGGTNILFSDEGFDGLILKPNIQFIKRENNTLRVGAGVSITQLLNYLITEGLAGLEWAAGLPGTLGGAIRGNAGAFGGEMKDVIKEVISLEIPKTKIIRRKKQECDFKYRTSIFKVKKNKEIILEATLVLKKGNENSIKELIEKNINYRQQHQPLEYPNIGSIFKNVDLRRIKTDNKCVTEGVKRGKIPVKTDPFPVIPAAYLISETGLKGLSFGGAMISPKHPNFIVNVLNAAAADVKNLILLAKEKVYDKFKVKLEEEIEYL